MVELLVILMLLPAIIAGGPFSWAGLALGGYVFGPVGAIGGFLAGATLWGVLWK